MDHVELQPQKQLKHQQQQQESDDDNDDDDDNAMDVAAAAAALLEEGGHDDTDEDGASENYNEEDGGEDQEMDEEKDGENDRNVDDDYVDDGFWRKIPTSQDIMEMKRSCRRLSDWLKLLCEDWVYANDGENVELAEGTNAKLLEYKPYLKDAMISPQLLCRLCQQRQQHQPHLSSTSYMSSSSSTLDFWNILNITDEFDKAYIVAQVERFESMYNILSLDERVGKWGEDTRKKGDVDIEDQSGQSRGKQLLPRRQLTSSKTIPEVAEPILNRLTASQRALPKRRRSKTNSAVIASTSENIRPHKKKQSRKRLSKQEETRIRKRIEREQIKARQEIENQLKVQQREQEKQRKAAEQRQRGLLQEERKIAALQRAAELVESNRIPIELTGTSASNVKMRFVKNIASTGGDQKEQGQGQLPHPSSLVSLQSHHPRSAVVVSTASDLQQIVTHSNNLYAKYKAIAEAHNTRFSWATVVKDIGIGVKVREKYARMYNRGVQQNFDFDRHGHWKLRDHPEIFMEPSQTEHKKSESTTKQKRPQYALPSLDNDGTSPAVAGAAMDGFFDEITKDTTAAALMQSSPTLSSLYHPEFQLDPSIAAGETTGAPSSPGTRSDIAHTSTVAAGSATASSSLFPPSFPSSPVNDENDDDGVNDE